MRRKGVSPVIATLLLIVIAVAAAVLTYIWVTGYMGTLQAGAGAQQVQERIKIEGIEIDTKTNETRKVYVRNIGDVNVTITTVYLLDTGGNVITSNTTVKVTLAPESSRILNNPLGITKLAAGKTYVIKIVTSRGTEATYQFTYRP